MRSEVQRAAKRCDIMVGSLNMWPVCAMSAFLDACQRLKPTCEWSEIEEGTGVYNTCKNGEEWHLPQGLELFPYCQWCGREIAVISDSDSGTAPHG